MKNRRICTGLYSGLLHGAWKTALGLFLVVFASGCSTVRNIKNIEVLGCDLVSISPKGLRSLDAELALHIQNPAMQFTLEDISGTLFYKDKAMVDYTASPITVKARTTAVYPLPCGAALSEGVTIINALGTVRGATKDDFTTDIHARIRFANGISKGFTLRDIKVAKLLEDDAAQAPEDSGNGKTNKK